MCTPTCIYVCICVYMHVRCVYVCIQTYPHMFTYMYIWLCLICFVHRSWPRLDPVIEPPGGGPDPKNGLSGFTRELAGRPDPGPAWPGPGGPMGAHGAHGGTWGGGMGPHGASIGGPGPPWGPWALCGTLLGPTYVYSPEAAIAADVTSQLLRL